MVVLKRNLVCLSLATNTAADASPRHVQTALPSRKVGTSTLQLASNEPTESEDNSTLLDGSWRALVSTGEETGGVNQRAQYAAKKQHLLDNVNIPDMIFCLPLTTKSIFCRFLM